MEKIGQRSTTGSGDATLAQTTHAIADTQSPGFKGDIPLEGESQGGGYFTLTRSTRNFTAIKKQARSWLTNNEMSNNRQ